MFSHKTIVSESRDKYTIDEVTRQMSHKRNVKKYIQVLGLVGMILFILLHAQNMREMHKQVWNELEHGKKAVLAVKNPRVNYMTNPIGIDESDIFFSWEPSVEQKAYEIIVGKVSVSQKEERGLERTLVWDSGVRNTSQTLGIAYEGLPLEDGQRYEYTVFVFDDDDNLYCSEAAFFETAFVNGDPFNGADMISMSPEENIYEDGQAVYYTSFDLQKKGLQKATFYGSALGVYDAYLNGQRIGEDELKPGWTDYNDTLLYNTYDITSYLKEKNTIAAMVGTGWWCGRNGFGTYGYQQPAFVCQIILQYEDGSKQVINTNENWSYCKNTAVRFADFFNGETYDASAITTAQISEALPVSEADEKPVHISTSFTGEFKSFYGYNVKFLPEKNMSPKQAYIYSEVKQDGSDFGSVVVSDSQVTFPIELKKGEVLIVDLGQNMTGVPYVRYRAEKGTKIEIQFAEMLNDSGEKERGNDGPKGSLYRANYRSATTNVTVLAGGSEEAESYHPTFFYTGFRYLSLRADADITLEHLEGLFLGNSAPEIGTVDTDQELVTQLWKNASWSQRNNFMLVATDCPQRDERIGWMGDLCSFAETSMYMQELYSFYKKWMKDVRDAQTPEGAYTDTVPSTITTGSGNAGWAEAGILVPLSVYKKYGDVTLLREHYPSMQSYMDYLASISSYKPQDKRLGPLTTYGDWLSTQLSDSNLISVLWYEADALAMIEVAELLGERADERKYRSLHKKINAYMMETYAYKMPWNEKGAPRATEEIEYPLSQTEMLFLLRYAQLSKKQEQLIVAQLKQNIADHNYKVMTGFAGTPLLLPVLTEYGMTEEAYKILLCEENPSWIYSVLQGATTIWERYDSYTKEHGFADAAMNSFNHFNEGSVAQWMQESMLGIRVDLSQKYPITICPSIPSEKVDITCASGYYDSVYGRITCSWKKNKDGTITVSAIIPENTRAKVILPMNGMKEMIVSGGKYEWNGKYKLLE